MCEKCVASCNSSSQRECSPEGSLPLLLGPQPCRASRDILGYFGSGLCPWNAFLAFQPKNLCCRRYRKAHEEHRPWSRTTKRRFKQDNVRVLRFPCPGFNSRLRAPVPPSAPGHLQPPQRRARSCPGAKFTPGTWRHLQGAGPAPEPALPAQGTCMVPSP